MLFYAFRECPLPNFVCSRLQCIKTHILHIVQQQNVLQFKYVLSEKPTPGGLLIIVNLFSRYAAAVDLGHEETVMKFLNQTLAAIIQYMFINYPVTKVANALSKCADAAELIDNTQGMK